MTASKDFDAKFLEQQREALLALDVRAHEERRDEPLRREDGGVAGKLVAALDLYVSWGYFDPGKSDYVEGYQCPPVNWGINSPRKKEFFTKLTFT